MHHYTLLAFAIYFCILITIGLLASRKQKNDTDFMLGGRRLNYWVTAISANAADMSAWLFLGMPMAIYAEGFMQFWTAISLVIFMFLNWHIVAPRLRVATEKYGSLTLFSFFEARTDDKSGMLRITSAFWCLLFLTTYVAANLSALGNMFELLFGVNYYYGCFIGIAAIAFYTYIGGFSAIAWTDFFQGIFLLVAIIIVPLLAMEHVGGMSAVVSAAEHKGVPLTLFPDFSQATLLSILSMTVGWGFGYFGQPHILNKFMGIDKASELHKSKYVSTAWQILALSASAFAGLVAIAYFHTVPLHSKELIFPQMVNGLFHPFLGGFILCAVFAATLSTMDSMLLVLASVLAEDIYKKTLAKNPSEKQVLWASRISVVIVACVALVIAFNKSKTIFDLVNFCWVGLGCAFGPLVLMSLYAKNITRQGALVGMLFGGIVGALWGVFNTQISAMLPGFFGGLLVIYLVSKLTK